MVQRAFRLSFEWIGIYSRIYSGGNDCRLDLCVDLFLGDFRAGRGGHATCSLDDSSVRRTRHVWLHLPHGFLQLLPFTGAFILCPGDFLAWQGLGVSCRNCLGPPYHPGKSLGINVVSRVGGIREDCGKTAAMVSAPAASYGRCSTLRRASLPLAPL